MRWLHVTANQSNLYMLSFLLAAQSDASFIQLGVSLKCPKIKSLNLSHESAYFILHSTGRPGKRASIMSVAFVIKAGLDRVQFALKSHRTSIHLPGNWPHLGRTQPFQKVADPGPSVTIYRKELIVSTVVTLLGRWRFVTPANGTELASCLELLHVTTKLVNGLFDLSHHAT